MITGAAVLGGDGGDQRVEATDPGVSVLGSLLGYPWTSMMVSSMSTHDRAVDPGQQWRVFSQPAQQPGRDGVELADVTETEFPQERPQR